MAAPAAQAAATYTGAVDPSAHTATLDGAGDIGLSAKDGLVQHEPAGSGFASAQDFDSTQPGDQTVPDSGGWTVTVKGGGKDRLDITEAEPPAAMSFAFGHTFFPGGVPCVVRDPNDRGGAIAFSRHPAQETRFCYQAGFDEVRVHAADHNTDFGVLDTEPGVTLRLFGGVADDTMTEVADVPSSVPGEFHNPASPVYFDGGHGGNSATFNDGPATAPATYTIGGGTIRKTGLPPLHFVRADSLAIYPQKGPSKIVVGRTGGAGLQVFGGFFRQTGPDTIDARGADAPLFATGSTGDDKIFGSVYPDYIDGGGGNDTIDSRDASFDQVLCEGGTGAVSVDSIDKVTDCPAAKVSPPLVALRSARFTPGKVKRGKRLALDVLSTTQGKVKLEFKRGVTKSVPVRLGANTVGFKPPARLKKGRYKVTATLSAPGGKKSKPVKLSLTVR
jgi:hypothetical protein